MSILHFKNTWLTCVIYLWKIITLVKSRSKSGLISGVNVELICFTVIYSTFTPYLLRWGLYYSKFLNNLLHIGLYSTFSPIEICAIFFTPLLLQIYSIFSQNLLYFYSFFTLVLQRFYLKSEDSKRGVFFKRCVSNIFSYILHLSKSNKRYGITVRAIII